MKAKVCAVFRGEVAFRRTVDESKWSDATQEQQKAMVRVAASFHHMQDDVWAEVKRWILER